MRVPHATAVPRRRSAPLLGLSTASAKRKRPLMSGGGGAARATSARKAAWERTAVIVEAHVCALTVLEPLERRAAGHVHGPGIDLLNLRAVVLLPRLLNLPVLLFVALSLSDVAALASKTEATGRRAACTSSPKNDSSAVTPAGDR